MHGRDFGESAQVEAEEIVCLPANLDGRSLLPSSAIQIFYASHFAVHLLLFP